MPRPRHVDLGPHRHAIRFPREIEPSEEESAAGHRRIGEAQRGHNVILVSSDLAPTHQASTLIHEILHMAFHDSAIHQTAGWNDEVEEYVIQTLEPRLLEVFTRNPKVVAWLASGGSA